MHPLLQSSRRGVGSHWWGGGGGGVRGAFSLQHCKKIQLQEHLQGPKARPERGRSQHRLPVAGTPGSPGPGGRGGRGGRGEGDGEEGGGGRPAAACGAGARLLLVLTRLGAALSPSPPPPRAVPQFPPPRGSGGEWGVGGGRASLRVGGESGSCCPPPLPRVPPPGCGHGGDRIVSGPAPLRDLGVVVVVVGCPEPEGGRFWGAGGGGERSVPLSCLAPGCRAGMLGGGAALCPLPKASPRVPPPSPWALLPPGQREKRAAPAPPPLRSQYHQCSQCRVGWDGKSFAKSFSPTDPSGQRRGKDAPWAPREQAPTGGSGLYPIPALGLGDTFPVPVVDEDPGTFG